MDQLLLQDLQLQMEDFYQKIKIALLDKHNYSEDIQNQNVQLFFQFLEATFEKAFNRIVHIHLFLHSDNYLMIERMYPLCFLKESAKGDIKRCYLQALWLMDGLEGHDHQAADLLRLEKYEMDNCKRVAYPILDDWC